MGVWQITGGVLQDEIDRALSDDDVQAFLDALPWEDLPKGQGEGLDNWSWKSFTAFLERHGFKAPLDQSNLRTAPYFMWNAVPAGDNTTRLRHGQMLLDALDSRGLLSSILPPTTEALRAAALAAGLLPVTAYVCEECGVALYHKTQDDEKVRFDERRHVSIETTELPWSEHGC